MSTADVCLIVEGAYPYVTGGVASWTHQLISGLPDVRFALVTILPDPSFARGDKYAVPANVVTREHLYLFGEPPAALPAEPPRAFMQAVEAMHATPTAARCPHVTKLAAEWRADGVSSAALQGSRGAWAFMTKQYEQLGRQVSFLDYFWTWRATHGPIFRLFDGELPKASVYHSLSTGYAGMLAALGASRHGGGMLLTEHGIYTRERDIEIVQAEWIYQEAPEGSAYAPDDPFFKRWWREQYRFLAQVAYQAADKVVALNEVNRGHQVKAGAPDEKMAIVPNGVPIARYAPLRAARDWHGRPFRVALIGRAVPIKDVKTFIRGVHLANLETPVEAFVLGPLDEDPDYALECTQLVDLLELGDVLTFTGSVDVQEWLPRMDLVALTSVSESQPLVVLEANAAGLPTVCTDVGGCREMLEGRPGEDARLGPSGLVVPVASPDAVAEAIVALARQPERYQALARAAVERVERFYREEVLFEGYRQLYRELAPTGPTGRRG